MIGLERTVYKTKLGNDLFEGIIKRKKNQQFNLTRIIKFSVWYTNYTADLTRKNAPNQADNIVIFRSCFLPKMRLSVVLEGRAYDQLHLVSVEKYRYLNEVHFIYFVVDLFFKQK